MVRSPSLPVWQLQHDILDAVRNCGRLVLVAPTGSGKTTQVPQLVLDSGLAGQKRIVVLQPRRVAARTVAARVAWERGTPLGQEVGYQVRFDDQTSLGTRICFVTEGILLRWLQSDPLLADVSTIVFDEFHERNLLSDVALALAKRLQRQERPDLRLLVMSATLEAEPVAEYLSKASEAQPGPVRIETPVLHSEGISYPVEVRYLEQHDQRPASQQACDVIERLVQAGEPGDILVFMPGMGEINATIAAARSIRAGERLAFIPLHGELPPEEQDLAFAPNPLRKVVVATNVAETSVTIDGIRHVVDSGLARVARYDADRGISTLFIEPISRASAEQRKGRAGRTGPGICHRLWTESSQLNRPERNTPEIQRSDLAEVVLLLHSLGVRKAATFDWLDKPEPQAVERAERLLQTLGALKTPAQLDATPAPDEKRQCGDLTSLGARMLHLPMHPRYSRMLVEAARYGCVPAAALCAALVSGRDLMVRLGRDDARVKEARELFEASQESDFHTLMRAYQFAKNNGFNVESCRRHGIHAQTARQIDQTFEQILQLARHLVPEPALLPVPAGQDPLLRCLMAGFVDQLCRRRSSGTLECDLTEGRQGTLLRESVVQSANLFVAGTLREVPGRGSEPLVLLGLASAVQREWIEASFPEQVTSQVEHLYDRTHKRVAAVNVVRFQDLVIHHQHQSEVEPAAAGRCLAQACLKGYFELPLFKHELKQFIARINVLTRAMPELELPPFDAAALQRSLARAFAGLTLAKEAQATPLHDAFRAHLRREQLAWIDEMAPLVIHWPDGRKLKLLYPESAGEKEGPANPPELQVKLHECFGLQHHPKICEGRLPVRLWLCGPDGKRLEATSDWLAFKKLSYPKLKANLQRKYPGVSWL